MKTTLKAENFKALIAASIDLINQFSRAKIKEIEEKQKLSVLKFNFIEGGANEEETLKNILNQVVALMKIHDIGFEEISVHEEPNGAYRIEMAGEKIVLG